MTTPMDLHQMKITERFEVLNAMTVEELDALYDECKAEAKRQEKAGDLPLRKRMLVYAESAQQISWNKRFA